jgi:hypothetical protein
MKVTLQFFDRMKRCLLFRFLAGTLAPIHEKTCTLVCRDVAKTMPVERKKQEYTKTEKRT